MPRRTTRILGFGALLALLAVVYMQGRVDERAGAQFPLTGIALAQGQEGLLLDPTAAEAERDVYFPGTEELAPDEMRIFSCGTGMPSARESQAASCFLVELGNGDKFLFDAGTGSHVRIGSLGIPYDFLDKIFLSHLHTDHFGDFAAYSVGGWVAGRQVPLHIYGPSGSSPEMGTKYAVERWMEALTWDIEGRAGRLPPAGGEVVVHEFDYRGENEIVYQENGVTIRSWPAIHSLDGPVSYSLEWNGLKFVFGGDTYPNQWFIRYAQGADVAVHECMMAVEDWITKYNFPVGRALNVGTQIHTTPESFGKIMSEVKPRLAIAFHFFNDFDTQPRVMEGVRSTYDGPLSLADDYMVWNVTKDDIRVRSVVVDPDMWPPPSAYPPQELDQSLSKWPSEWIDSGKWAPAREVDQAVYDRINAQYGTDFKQAGQ
jgi:ribonuclease Z